MRAKIQKWGNSLALRIPRLLAEESGISNYSVVEISLVEDNLVISPVKEVPSYGLEQLLEQITPDNLHAEVNSGPTVGKEIW